ncbi:3'-5' exonuclease-like [Lotus japonicus]|uniref:3'-5' exonuclease-like n=1 Tax=Lotus japonicus TaxID=34305 RepID=UPI0025846B2B|nr:3'-5' exonuclease-like [Lotus japonicus]
MNPSNATATATATATPTTTPIPPAVISVVDHELPDDTHNLYDITFDSHTIRTLVTSFPSFVDSWLTETLNPNPSASFLVGLDIEWRPNLQRNADHRVATLQLCIGLRCLVFQIFHAPSIPASLFNFLANPNHTFVGVGIAEDAEKLLLDYDLGVANTVDLRTVAADVMSDPALKNAGIRTLAQRVMGRDVAKPRRITMSKWDNLWLVADQVQYAAVDAFVSSQIGLTLFQK